MEHTASCQRMGTLHERIPACGCRRCTGFFLIYKEKAQVLENQSPLKSYRHIIIHLWGQGRGDVTSANKNKGTMGKRSGVARRATRDADIALRDIAKTTSPKRRMRGAAKGKSLGAEEHVMGSWKAEVIIPDLAWSGPLVPSPVFLFHSTPPSVLSL